MIILISPIAKVIGFTETFANLYLFLDFRSVFSSELIICIVQRIISSYSEACNPLIYYHIISHTIRIEKFFHLRYASNISHEHITRNNYNLTNPLSYDSIWVLSATTTGDWSNGMIGVSKTFGGSSILSSPVNLVHQGCTGFSYFVRQIKASRHFYNFDCFLIF